MNWTNWITIEAAQNFGWTLLHTFWQGAMLATLLWILLQFVPKRNATVRYVASAITLVLILASGVFTLSYLTTSSPVNESAFIMQPTVFNPQAHLLSYESEIVSLKTVIVWINQHMAFLVSAWAIGVILCMIRFMGGLLFIHSLKRKSKLVTTHWSGRLKELSASIGITRMVSLAQSMRIDKPIVIGHLKPIIILPVGLLTGLPTVHIEAILLHELSHIRRHDYLINLIQSVIEIVLFFNPFVWIISNSIRKEREHCCDDQVIHFINPTHYVHALAQLEEFRVQRITSLALAFNGNKFHVINRIKRIMEKSVNAYTPKVRPLALALLMVVGMVCASWLSVNSEAKNTPVKNTVTQLPVRVNVSLDTPKKKDKRKEKDKVKEKSATYSRKSITTYDENGKPHEEITEEFKGDEDLRPLLANPDDFSIPPLPSIPDLSMLHDPIVMGMMALPGLAQDTLPGWHFYDRDSEKWEQFGEKMREQFEGFAQDEEFNLRMKEWGERMGKWGEEFAMKFGDDFGKSLEDLHEKLDHLPRSGDIDLDRRGMEEALDRMREELRLHESDLRKAEGSMRQFEEALDEQLIKDGYLSKGDKIESFNWDPEGNLTVNGKKIQKKDMKKYQEINERFFGKKGKVEFKN